MFEFFCLVGWLFEYCYVSLLLDKLKNGEILDVGFFSK